jgi:hypothetical protein
MNNVGACVLYEQAFHWRQRSYSGVACVVSFVVYPSQRSMEPPPPPNFKRRTVLRQGTPVLAY